MYCRTRKKPVLRPRKITIATSQRKSAKSKMWFCLLAFSGLMAALPLLPVTKTIKLGQSKRSKTVRTKNNPVMVLETGLYTDVQLQ